MGFRGGGQIDPPPAYPGKFSSTIELKLSSTCWLSSNRVDTILNKDTLYPGEDEARCEGGEGGLGRGGGGGRENRGEQ